MKDFFAKHQLDIQSIGCVCADGVPAILGNKPGFSALIKQEIPRFQVICCFLHRFASVLKILPTKLKKVLGISVKCELEVNSVVMSMSLDRYFDLGKMKTSEEWIVNPRYIDLDQMSDDGKMQKDPSELSSNRALT